MLYEETKRKRQRTKTINIQITVISWSLEFIAGLIFILIWFIENRRIVIISDMVVNFILIPLVYVMNNDVNKGIIVAEGWLRGFRRLINQRFTVVPNQNNEGENPGNRNPVPAPIPSISRNIAERENRERRRGNNLCQATSVGFTAQRLYAATDAEENVPRRRGGRSESNQISSEEVVQSSSNARIDLEDEANKIETIPLDDPGESRAQDGLISSIAGPFDCWV